MKGKRTYTVAYNNVPDKFSFSDYNEAIKRVNELIDASPLEFVYRGLVFSPYGFEIIKWSAGTANVTLTSTTL